MVRKKKISYADKLKLAYAAVMTLPEGQTVLRHVLCLSGYNEPLMMLNPVTHDVNSTGSIVNLAKRDVWYEVRKYLNPTQIYLLEQAEALDLARSKEVELKADKEQDDDANIDD